MTTCRYALITAIAICLIAALGTPAWANKTSVQIEVPATVSAGTTLTIRLHVTHDGNSWFHYTDWVRVTVNGTELKRWEFSRKNRPENENFTLEVTYPVTAAAEITAEANCNLHGSAGPAFATVNLE